MSAFGKWSSMSLVLIAMGAVSSAYASEYTCRSKFDSKLDFQLKVGRKQVVLSQDSASCRTVLDSSYRPTEKYAGYSRFQMATNSVDACREFMITMLGKGNTFKGLKVSGDLLDGEYEGYVTLVIDDGDYHGQLRNEKIYCATNN